jgi:hypothetical protein
MFRRTLHDCAACGVVVAVLGATASSIGVLFAASANDACGLLTAAEIMKTTSISVANGTPGAAVPGVLGRCTWLAADNTKVIVTLADASHMQTTIAAQLKSGGKEISGIGSKAVAIKGAGFNGGGYVLSALDAKGGFGVSILGKNGTEERVVALAKVVEGHR